MGQPDAIRAVVFDLDGLMVDTERLFFQVGWQMVEARGGQPCPELLRRMMGRRAVDAIGWMKDQYGLAEPGELLVEESRRRMARLIETELRPMPGLDRLLAWLESRPVPRAVATSSGRSYTRAILDRLDLGRRFAFVLTAEDVARGKPEPEIYLRAAARFGLDPAQTLVLEDSPAGLAAARAAGAPCIVVPHELTDRTLLAGAAAVVDRLDASAVLERIAGAQIAPWPMSRDE